MGCPILLAVLLVAVLAAPGQASDITVNPTLPPGLWSIVTGGTSPINSQAGTYSLGGNTTTFYLSTLLLLPLLIGVVILDFGIFGAYATRREDLNPVSRFVFNVREGFNNVRNRQSDSRSNTADWQKFTAR